MDLSALYYTDYVDSTYGGLEGVRRNYERIMNLDPDQSDNVGRISRITKFAHVHFEDLSPIRILDIGSGLGVFLAEVTGQTDWQCTALEPDPRLAEHIREELRIETVEQDYLNLEWDRQFDIITLNKVLEHVQVPIDMLRNCVRDLATGGFLYLELPDGKAASEDEISFGREEFFIEHHHIFTEASMNRLTRSADLSTILTERICEPSSKHTLYSILDHVN